MVADHRGLYVSRRQLMHGAGMAGPGLVGGSKAPRAAQPPPRIARAGVLAGGAPAEPRGVYGETFR